MDERIIPIGKYLEEFNNYLPFDLKPDIIYRSVGLEKHILKRHPECLHYVSMIPDIIENPDYIGVNPNESGKSFKLIKIISENVQIGIKLDTSDNYLYITTLHTITDSKLRHNIENGRIKKFDK